MAIVKIISRTHGAGHLAGIEGEELIIHNARVSNPNNQNLESVTTTGAKLLGYLIKHEHWSPFEQASMGIEIQTSRAIAAQILRHRSFVFQEFSQRYSSITGFEDIELRKQAEKNRQSSTEPFDPLIEATTFLPSKASDLVNLHIEEAQEIYEALLKNGVARESARMILPLCTSTTLYMTGSARSWIHYINLRTKPDTQKEHRVIAETIKEIFTAEFPWTAEALGWI